jgi:hypothetical protein
MDSLRDWTRRTLMQAVGAALLPEGARAVNSLDPFWGRGNGEPEFPSVGGLAP